MHQDVTGGRQRSTWRGGSPPERLNLAGPLRWDLSGQSRVRRTLRGNVVSFLEYMQLRQSCLGVTCKAGRLSTRNLPILCVVGELALCLQWGLGSWADSYWKVTSAAFYERNFNLKCTSNYIRMSRWQEKLDNLSISSVENTIRRKMNCHDILDLFVLFKD